MFGKHSGFVWQEKTDLEWYWVEKVESRYLCAQITCVQAAYILDGCLAPPKHHRELDPANFDLISEETVRATFPSDPNCPPSEQPEWYLDDHLPEEVPRRATSKSETTLS